MLAQERSARESAEERAQRLEMERKDSIHPSLQTEELIDHQMNGTVFPTAPEQASIEEKSLTDLSDPSVPSEDPSKKLQQRLDKVLSEMQEMKSQMESYRTRAEKAEETSARDRKTLAEMIEKVRQDEDKRASVRAASRGRRSRSASHSTKKAASTMDGTAETGNEITVNNEQMGQEEVAKLFKKAGLQNGRPVTPEQVKQLEHAVSQALATRQRRGEQLAQVGPYASILGVVCVGMALMAYLNGWQKIER